jgi:predicted ester cyclase
MTPAENKALVRGYFTAISGNDKPASLLNEFTNDAALFEHVAMFEAAFPHYVLVAEDMLAEADQVAVRARFQGTHQGELMGIAPTGKTVDLPFQIIYRIADGKLAEHWMSVDQLSLLRQLGVMQ